MPRIEGPSHIDLTVTDIERSVRWWEEVMGFSHLNDGDHGAWRTSTMFHPSGFAVTIVCHDTTAGADRFDETRVGLDHLAFAVASREELDAWVAHLDSLGVTHTGVIEAHFGDTVVLRDPDNTQLELFVFPAVEDLGDLVANDPDRML